MSNQVKIEHSRKTWGSLIVIFAFVFIPVHSMAQNIPQEAGQVSVTSVAKKASPSVVSISVISALKDRSQLYYNGREYQYEDPFDFFSDKFYQEYFGLPKREVPARQKFQTGQASGFIVSVEGHILTNAHVVNNADKITVTLNDGSEFEGKVIGADPNTDVAIVKIEGDNLPYLKLGNSDELEVGQWVVAIGNPLGLQTSVTAGIVSAKGRNNLSLARVEDFIQTDAAINRGNSGGPLLNLNSEVIGMNTAIVTNLGSGGYMGIGFAIPSNILHYVMEELMASGTISRGYLGVTLQQINHDLAQAFGMQKIEGALVSEVAKDSPAEQAGLHQGDVILQYNNKKVDNIAALRNAISLMKPGTKVNLTLSRDGKMLNLLLTIGTFPDDAKQLAQQNENKLGLEVETLDPETARKFGYKSAIGVVITNIKPGSPAAWAGLKKGTLIVSVNHKEIRNVEEFQHLLRQSNENQPVLLLVRQGENMHYVSIKTSS